LIGAPHPYGNFADLVRFLIQETSPDSTVSIITFNYDVVIDIALLRSKLRPDYGKPMAPPMHNGFRSIPLLKLHGSLNWAIEEAEPHAIRPLDLERYLMPAERPFRVGDGGHYTSVQLLSHLVKYFSDKHRVRVQSLPYIVPPSWNKADYHRGLTDVWASAADHLAEALYIFVIGYSLPLTDSFFRQLYALGSAGEARLRKFVVFDPDPNDEVDARFKDLTCHQW
jgi:hypothetical protein